MHQNIVPDNFEDTDLFRSHVWLSRNDLYILNALYHWDNAKISPVIFQRPFNWKSLIIKK